MYIYIYTYIQTHTCMCIRVCILCYTMLCYPILYYTILHQTRKSHDSETSVLCAWVKFAQPRSFPSILVEERQGFIAIFGSSTLPVEPAYERQGVSSSHSLSYHYLFVCFCSTLSCPIIPYLFVCVSALFTHRPLSSSFWGLPYRIRNISHKEELHRGLWVHPLSTTPKP